MKGGGKRKKKRRVDESWEIDENIAKQKALLGLLNDTTENEASDNAPDGVFFDPYNRTQILTPSYDKSRNGNEKRKIVTQRMKLSRKSAKPGHRKKYTDNFSSFERT